MEIHHGLGHDQQEGWDARLPLVATDFYYQFKLSDYLWRRNAKFRIRPNRPQEDCIYAEPYYRFWLHHRNNNQQHRRLRSHCLTSPNTYYVAPEFNTLEDFNDRFLARQITINSRIIPLTACKDINDADRHCVTYRRADPAWIIHSESYRVEKSFSGEQLEVLYRQSEPDWQPVDLRFSRTLFEKTREMAKRLFAEEDPSAANRLRPLLDEPTKDDRQHLLLRTADILSAALGLTLVLVGTGE